MRLITFLFVVSLGTLLGYGVYKSIHTDIAIRPRARRSVKQAKPKIKPSRRERRLTVSPYQRYAAKLDSKLRAKA